MGSAGVVGVGVHIDVLGLQLGIQDGLAGIKAIVAGEHVADAAGQSEVQKAAVAEQLHRQKDGGHRAVDGAAEHGHQSQCRREAGGDAQQGPHHTAEGGSHEEGGHHLAALEAGAQRNGGEQQLQQKGRRMGRSLLHGPGDHVHAGAVIIRGAAEVR